MIKLFWIPLIFVSFLMPQEMDSVTVYRAERIDRLQIFAKNENLFPVTIEVNFDLQNLEADRYLPITDVLKPFSNVHLLDLKFTETSFDWDYETTYSFYMGNIFAEHDDAYVYRLPFAVGKEYRLTQGFEGSFTHQGNYKYSLDFDLSSGDEVYASRGGLVVALEESNDRGGPLKQYMNYANFVTIMHEDGTFADYSHLMKDGVKVEIGDNVLKGQLIGFSGSTGYASGPHLHFVVKKAKKGGGFTSIPVKFATQHGIAELAEGEIYAGF